MYGSNTFKVAGTGAAGIIQTLSDVLLAYLEIISQGLVPPKKYLGIPGSGRHLSKIFGLATFGSVLPLAYVSAIATPSNNSWYTRPVSSIITANNLLANMGGESFIKNK